MIIGITGQKRSGKDTTANYIIESLIHKYNFKTYHLASPIKKIARIMFGWDERHEDGDLKEVIDLEYGFSPREFYQWFGTEVVQKALPKRFEKFNKLVGRKVWMKNFDRFYNINKDYNIIIPDIRFPHEAEELNKYEGTHIIKVVRENLITKDLHESELLVNDIKYDRITHNDSDLKAFYEKLENNIIPLLDVLLT